MQRSTFKIGEILLGLSLWDYMGTYVCPCCDEHIVAILDGNPGSVQEAIGVVDMCEACWNKIHYEFDGKYSDAMWDYEVREKYRAMMGLRPFEEINKLFWDWADNYAEDGITWDEFKAKDGNMQEEPSEEEIAWMMYSYGVGPKPIEYMSPREQDFENYQNEIYRSLQ